MPDERAAARPIAPMQSSDLPPPPDRKIPGFVFVLLLLAILGAVAWGIVSMATGEPG